jgi:hypothetical protein
MRGTTWRDTARTNPRGESGAAPTTVLWLMVALLAGCGDGSGQDAQTAAADGSDIEVCELLTNEQVSSVLPGHDGGFVAASGAPVSEGISSYQCSYSAHRTDDFDLLTLVLTIASDPDDFEQWVRPRRSSREEGYPDLRDLEIGDGGMLFGDQDDMEVEVWNGLTLISLELTAPGAKSRSDALVDLAAVVAAKIE